MLCQDALGRHAMTHQDDGRTDTHHAKAPAEAPGAAGFWTGRQREAALREGSAPPVRRTFRQRMFGVGLSGWVRLVVVCLPVGVLFEASRVNPFAPDFTFAGMASSLATGAGAILSWSITNGWRPLLIGAIVVGPVWLLWRAVWALFRK